MAAKRFKVKAENSEGTIWNYGWTYALSVEDWAICSVNGLEWGGKRAEKKGEAINVEKLVGSPLTRVSITDNETGQTDVLLAEQLVGMSPTHQHKLSEGCVYVLRSAAGIKIGTTTRDPEFRRRRIFYGGGQPVELIGCWPGDKTDEGKLHRHFVVQLLPGQREWFEESGELAQWIARLEGQVGVSKWLAIPFE